MSSVREFFELLFEPHESTCVSKDVYGKDVVTPFYNLHWSKNFFSINPLLHYRADVNVTSYRNILIEMDKISLPEQLYILQQMPVSTIVYSGGKSYHAIISLETPLANRTEYDNLVKRIYDKVTDADKSTKNPSRFSRLPGAMRENGKYQDLMFVGKRILLTTLIDWLGPELKTEKPKVEQTVGIGWHRILNPFTKHFLKYGVVEGHWHDSLVKATCDMARSGFSIDEIEGQVYAINGTLDKHDKATISSCYKMAKGDK